MMAGVRRRKVRGGNGSDYFSSTSTSESWTTTLAEPTSGKAVNRAETNVLVAAEDEDEAIETSIPRNEESVLAISSSSHTGETPPRDLLTDWISETEEDEGDRNKMVKFLNHVPLVDDATTLSSTSGDKVDCLKAPIYQQDKEYERKESDTAMELASSFFGKLTTDIYETISLPKPPTTAEIRSRWQNKRVNSEGTELTNWSDPIPGHEVTDAAEEVPSPEPKLLPRNHSEGAADWVGLLPPTTSPGGSERNVRPTMAQNELNYMAGEYLEEKKVEDWSFEMLRSDSCSDLTGSPSIYRRTTTEALRSFTGASELTTSGQQARGLKDNNKDGTNYIPHVPRLVETNLGELEVSQTSGSNRVVVPGSVWKQRDWEAEIHKQQLTLLANTVTTLETKLDIFRHELQKRKALSEKMALNHDREMAEVHEQYRRLCQEKDATVERLRSTLDNERMEFKAQLDEAQSKKVVEALGHDMIGLQNDIQRVADAYAKVLMQDTESKQYSSHLQAPKRTGSTFSVASFLSVVGIISVLSALYFASRESLEVGIDFLCSPALPGTQLNAMNGVAASFEAPWWVPNYSSTTKADVFSLLCGERERAKITWEPHPTKGRGVLKLNSLVDSSETGGLETTIWTRHIAVLVELKSDHANIVHKTGNVERLPMFHDA